MTTLEKAARASYESHRNRLGFGAFPPWEEIPLTSREVYIEAQRAALSAALLDPSDEVVTAGVEAYLACRDANLSTAIRCVLHAAGVKIMGRGSG